MPDGGGPSLLWRPVARVLALGAKFMALWSARLSTAAQRAQSRAEGDTGQVEPSRPRLPWSEGEAGPPDHWLERLRHSRVPVRWITHRVPERARHDYAAPTQEELLPAQDPAVEPPMARESAVAPPEPRRPRPLRLQPTTRSLRDEGPGEVAERGYPSAPTTKADKADGADLAEAAFGAKAASSSRPSAAVEPPRLRRPSAENGVTQPTASPRPEHRSPTQPQQAEMQPREAPQAGALPLRAEQERTHQDRGAFGTTPQPRLGERSASAESTSGRHSPLAELSPGSTEESPQAASWPQWMSSWEAQPAQPLPPAPEEASKKIWPPLAEPSPSWPRPTREQGDLWGTTEAEQLYWPALPDEDETDSASWNWEARLRTWRRRQRLEREQRGDPWSESLF
jgi:hypothetical protein